MGINSTEVIYGFGQMGSAYIDDAGAYTPPTGKVVIAITVLDSATKFALLTPDTSGYLDGTTGAAGTGVNAYIGTTAVVAANGTNAEPIDTATVFKYGTTFYGRWTAVTLGAGSVVMYFGNA